MSVGVMKDYKTKTKKFTRLPIHWVGHAVLPKNRVLVFFHLREHVWGASFGERREKRIIPSLRTQTPRLSQFAPLSAPYSTAVKFKSLHVDIRRVADQGMLQDEKSMNVL